MLSEQFLEHLLSAQGDDCDDTIKSSALSVCREFGIEVVINPDLRISWDGRTIRTAGDSPSGPSPDHSFCADVAHEISHFQLAATWRRKMKEYGLGPGYATRDPVRRTVSRRHASSEETIVCYQSLSWLMSWGYSPVSEARELGLLAESGNEAWEDPERTEKSLVFLVGSGFMDSSFRPTKALRRDKRIPLLYF